MQEHRFGSFRVPVLLFLSIEDSLTVGTSCIIFLWIWAGVEAAQAVGCKQGMGARRKCQENYPRSHACTSLGFQ